MIDSCYVGDVRDGLRALIAAGVRAQTCVTSPPYWGLRDYGTAQWDGGDAACDHTTQRLPQPNSKQATSKGSARDNMAGRDCRLCGARRIDRQIGLESTPAEYVEHMVEVFRLVREVLADDGTLWLNLGDSYSAGSQTGGTNSLERGRRIDRMFDRGASCSGVAPKNLIGIPWRVAFALQADGWYLRSDIIWAKPNPMPESVTDRPTKAHEYLFLLAKSERYYYDAAAIAEASLDTSIERASRGGSFVNGRNDGAPYAMQHSPVAGPTRNRRTVWTIATEPYADAHFATFPTALVEPCILAGSRVGDVVLDPFMGSGTVAQVAQSLGRRWIGCELNPTYVELQKRRAAQRGLELSP